MHEMFARLCWYWLCVYDMTDPLPLLMMPTRWYRPRCLHINGPPESSWQRILKSTQSHRLVVKLKRSKQNKIKLMIILSCDHLTGVNFSPCAEFSSPCNVSSIERVALAVSHCSNLSNKTDNRENEWLWSVSVLNGNVFIRWWGDGNLNLCRPDGGRIAAGVVVLLVHKIQSQTM